MKKAIIFLTFGALVLLNALSAHAVNNCLLFDGSDDYVVSDLSGWNSATAFTVEAWIYTSVGNKDMKIVSKTDGSHSDGFAMDVGANKLYLELWLGNSSSPYNTLSTATFSNYEWTHIAMTWQSGGDMKGYINGVEVINVSTASYTLVNNGTLKIGAAPWNVSQFRFDGRLD